MTQHKQDKQLAKTALKKWENATDELAQIFKLVYFGKEADSYWIGDSIGGVVKIADMFFDPEQMADYIKYGYNRKQMFEHYDYALKEVTDGRTPISIETWIKIK